MIKRILFGIDDDPIDTELEEMKSLLNECMEIYIYLMSRK